jgi:FMN phosphatase YigB (HAD superfamily)
MRPAHIFFDVDGVLVDGFHFNPQYRKVWSANMQADLGIDPAFFHSVTNTLGVAAKDCLQVDDTPAVLESAAKAGWQTFWLETPHHTPQLSRFLNQETSHAR